MCVSFCLSFSCNLSQSLFLFLPLFPVSLTHGHPACLCVSVSLSLFPVNLLRVFIGLSFCPTLSLYSSVSHCSSLSPSFSVCLSIFRYVTLSLSLSLSLSIGLPIPRVSYSHLSLFAVSPLFPLLSLALILCLCLTHHLSLCISLDFSVYISVSLFLSLYVFLPLSLFL